MVTNIAIMVKPKIAVKLKFLFVKSQLLFLIQRVRNRTPYLQFLNFAHA